MTYARRTAIALAAAGATMAGAIWATTHVAGATTLGSAVNGAQLGARADSAVPLIEVRSRRGRRSGAVAGVVAGAIIGGIIASQARPRYYYEYPYPYYGHYGYPAYPDRAAAIAYCARRYRSFDPYSMTYLGYDGYRHPCP